MRTRVRLRLVAAAVVSTVAVSCGGGSQKSETSTTASANASALTSVTMTLNDGTTLPSRVQWVATPVPASAQVARVDFMIDGKLAWIEKDAPFVFGGDDDGANLGFLITTWLTP